MSGYGANGTDDQLDRVVTYFQKNLTVINVNTSPPEDLGETLQVKDDGGRGDHGATCAASLHRHRRSQQGRRR